MNTSRRTILLLLTATALLTAALARAADTPASQPAPSATGPGYVVVPSDIKTQPDGSLLLDGHFAVRGKGTEASPYEIGWDLLDSAGDVYDPGDDVRKLPQRVAMFDGKFVKLVSYALIPVRDDHPLEMLSMMNQWDGCCIGIAPTPFSSIDVHAPSGRISPNFNGAMVTIRGKLQVAPTLAKNWLTGFYKMDDAQVARVDF